MKHLSAVIFVGVTCLASGVAAARDEA